MISFVELVTNVPFAVAEVAVEFSEAVAFSDETTVVPFLKEGAEDGLLELLRIVALPRDGAELGPVPFVPIAEGASDNDTGAFDSDTILTLVAVELPLVSRSVE